MDKLVNKTVNALSRFGEHIERQFSIGDDHNDGIYPRLQRSGSNSMFPSARSAFQRPLDKKRDEDKKYSSKQRGLLFNGLRNSSSDNLAASPGYSSFNNYRQNPMPNPYVDGVDRPPYGTGIGGPLNYGYGGNYGGYSSSASSLPRSSSSGSVGYAPDYYIAERRQVELVPAPQPRIIQQPVPVPVDRPVPQPYPVEVPRYIPVDRPVPVPVPSPVPYDRPVCVPVPVAVPTPCYIPVAVPVPSPPPSPVMYEQSVTHTQRWTSNPPAVVNQQSYVSNPPVVVQQQSYVPNSPVVFQQQSYVQNPPPMYQQQSYVPNQLGVVRQQSYITNPPVVINPPIYASSTPAMGMNPYVSYGTSAFVG